MDLYQYSPLNIPVAVKSIQDKKEFARELYIMETIKSQYMPKLFYFDENRLKIYMELGLCSLEELREHQYRN